MMMVFEIDRPEVIARGGDVLLSYAINRTVLALVIYI